MNNTIASERTRLGLTQTQLGEQIGRDRTTIGRWEADATHVEAEYLFKLANIFGCSIDYILGRTENRTPQVVA